MPHYERFVEAFPTPAACAAAGSAEVVRRWSGLGYNRRALNLHRAADDHRRASRRPGAAGRRRSAGAPGRRRLHGAGGAVLRVRRRRGGRRHQRRAGARPRRRRRAGSPARPPSPSGTVSCPAAGSWEFNQSMFDLGATVCTAARPGCGRCPLRRQCAWRRGGGRRPLAGQPGGATRRARSPAPTARAGGVCSRRCGVATSLTPAIAGACGWPEDGGPRRPCGRRAGGRGLRRVGERNASRVLRLR